MDGSAARARRRGKKARDGDEAHLHGLRIALKKLRYTAEFLAPLYPRRKVKRYVRELRGLQETLGAINDIAHVRATIAKLLRETEAKRPAPGERYAAVYEINLSRCIFCGYCELACPFDAITMGHDYEMADYSRHDLIFTKEMLLAEPIERTPLKSEGE